MRLQLVAACLFLIVPLSAVSVQAAGIPTTSHFTPERAFMRKSQAMRLGAFFQTTEGAAK